MRERTTKRKLPFTVGANGEQKDSDTGTHTAVPQGRQQALASCGFTQRLCSITPNVRGPKSLGSSFRVEMPHTPPTPTFGVSSLVSERRYILSGVAALDSTCQVPMHGCCCAFVHMCARVWLPEMAERVESASPYC